MFRESCAFRPHEPGTFFFGWWDVFQENPQDITLLDMVLDVIVIVAPKIVGKTCFFHIHG